MDDRELLILGALLHDAGKFRLRSMQTGEGKGHSVIGMEWLETKEALGLPKAVKTFAELHHQPYYEEIKKSNLMLIVYQADNISSQSDRIEKYGQFDSRNTPLMSVFSHINLNSRVKDKNEYKFHQLSEISEQVSFPEPLSEDLISQKQYEALWPKFEEDFDRLLQTGLSVEKLLLVLEKYWSRIPSETRRDIEKIEEYPDISLFDHSKTTAAIAKCLENYFLETDAEGFKERILEDEILDRSQPYYQLIGGDFTGVQDFIYTISSKGALKTLRARSFFLELLTEHVISEIAEVLSLSRSNVIYSGGGRFYILAQNTAGAVANLENIERLINHWLSYQFRIKLGLVLAGVKLTGNDLKTEKIAAIWSDLGSALIAKKGQKFSDELAQLFQPSEPQLTERSCSVCHRDDFKGELVEGRCPFCNSLFKLGDDLTDAKFILRGSQRIGEVENLKIQKVDGTTAYYAATYREPDSFGTLDKVYILNNWDIGEYRYPGSAPLLVGNYVRKVKDLPEEGCNMEKEDGSQDESTASFHGLGAAARGGDRIAVLRMDMDNLGLIFTRGIPENMRTFSRLATLSRELTSFFKYHINGICGGKLGKGSSPLDLSRKTPQETGRNLSIVYSGGDDLFIVGAWDEVTELAFDVRNSFNRFGGENPDVTISGGIVVQNPDFPLYRLAELARKAEERAKADDEKNKITLFYNPDLDQKRYKRVEVVKQTFLWRDAEEEVLVPLKAFLSLGKFEKNRFSSDLSRGLIYKLFGLFDQWEREGGKLYLPRMAYLVSRLKNSLRKLEIRESEAFKTVDAFLMNPGKVKSLRSTLIWLELLSRSSEHRT